jgi:hypothetical protein
MMLERRAPLINQERSELVAFLSTLKSRALFVDLRAVRVQ